uniref:F-box domain-containing protein n=2 Tax=Parascaris univalens TaxID=6257 RepID=A0A915AUL3_PARUN
MSRPMVSCTGNIFNASQSATTCCASSLSAAGDYSPLFRRLHSELNEDDISSCVAICRNPSSNSACNLAQATGSHHSQHTPVIVSPIAQHQTATGISELRSPFDATAFCASSPYAAAQSYFTNDTSTTSPILQASNFLPPYYGLSQSLTDFNMLHMCYQPLFSEITSPGSETSPTAESFYGFANRLHPITAGGVQPPQFVMPQSYPQARSGYMAGAMARPNSAAAKRGGRRPKEYEEYDHVALSEEERDKRDKRRLRNKEAAARCRQRRLDLMGSLQNQVDQLKEDNKVKDSKIAELQLLKNELLAVVREHQCVLPESLRQSLDVDMSSTQQYMPRGGTNIMLPTEVAPFTHTEQSSAQTLLGRKRPASELIPELRQPPQPTSMPNNSSTLSLTSTAQTNILPRIHVKQEPTLYDVNGRDTQEEEMKRPTSLSFSEGVAATTASYGALSSSGVPITTPSNLLGAGGSEFGAVNLLDGPTGLTPCHPPQATAFPLSSINTTPLGDGRSFESL